MDAGHKPDGSNTGPIFDPGSQLATITPHFKRFTSFASCYSPICPFGFCLFQPDFHPTRSHKSPLLSLSTISFSRPTMSCPNCGTQLGAPRASVSTLQSATLSDFDQQIIEADRILEDLRQQRYALLRQRNCRTPILSLPEEILQKIMFVAIESEQDDDPIAPEAAVQYRSPAKPPPPKFNALFFGKICSVWRDIAWKTSELWSTPNVTLRQNTTELHTELLQQWLDRANQRTLAVKLKADPNACRSSSVLPLLVSRSKHWKSIDISTPQWLSVLNHTRDQLPILDTVSVRCTIYAREQPITVFETAPLLTKADIALTTFGGTGSLVKINLPWSQLTDLKARWFSMDECVEVLRRATNLIDCEFTDIGPVKNLYPLPQEPVEVEDLESLKVHFQPEVAASPFFQWIQLPSLILLGVHARNMVPFRAVTELVSRSSCRLLRAKLEGPMQSEQDLIEFLEKMPSLIELSIHEHRENVISTNFLRELKPTKARCSPLRQRVAPKLEVLQYRDRARVLFGP